MPERLSKNGYRRGRFTPREQGKLVSLLVVQRIPIARAAKILKRPPETCQRELDRLRAAGHVADAAACYPDAEGRYLDGK